MSEDRTATWLREQIEAHAPENTEDPDAALRIAEACAALGGAVAPAFGLQALPPTLEGRDEIRQRGIEVLKRWIKRLDGDHMAKLKKMIAEYRLSGSQSDS
jgi:hypothetical protein